MDDSFATVSCYFNACGYERLKSNFMHFIEQLRVQQCNVYPIEIAFPGQMFCLPEFTNSRRLRAKSVMWQKEACINTVVRRLPRHIKYVAWIDGDILFQDDNWVLKTKIALEQHMIVQVFKNACVLDKEGKVSAMRRGIGWAIASAQANCLDFSVYHSGFGWAARRELLEDHGLYDSAIVGGADSAMVCAMVGELDRHAFAHYNDEMFRHFLSWAEPFSLTVNRNVGYVDGVVHHLWHGQLENRLYCKRHEYLKNYSPYEHVSKDAGGLLYWTSNDDNMKRDVLSLFRSRRDDG